jgi:hypothetical protein
VPSAFISYAHEDQEFVLALYEHLQSQGLDIRYDSVVLQIGDSLIETISREIVEGDFLIAIVSPDSVQSSWCQREVAIAATQGINEKQVKVLPVRFRGAEMPPMLTGIYWADADAQSVETIARRLAASMGAHIAGRGDDEAAAEAEAAEEADGERGHAEVPGDATVAQIDAFAADVWSVFEQWSAVLGGDASLTDLENAQRRLRWTLGNLSERIRDGLPLVEQFAEAEWDDFFSGAEQRAVESDLQEEMRSVRTQVAQGLAVTKRWTILAETGGRQAENRDAYVYGWRIGRGEDTRLISVFISGTVMAMDNGLAREVARAKETRGRSVVQTLLALDDPPRQVIATTAGISLTLP